MAEKFIQEATKNAHGQFKAKAREAGMSTREFAEKNKEAAGKLGKQARLALTLMKSSSSKKDSKPTKHSSKEARKAMYGKE